MFVFPFMVSLPAVVQIPFWQVAPAIGGGGAQVAEVEGGKVWIVELAGR